MVHDTMCKTEGMARMLHAPHTGYPTVQKDVMELGKLLFKIDRRMERLEEHAGLPPLEGAKKVGGRLGAAFAKMKVGGSLGGKGGGLLGALAGLKAQKAGGGTGASGNPLLAGLAGLSAAARR